MAASDRSHYDKKTNRSIERARAVSVAEPMTPSQARQRVFRGLGPPGLDRIDPPRWPGEQWHAHLTAGARTAAVNFDGTWKHVGAGQPLPTLTKKQATFLRAAGWAV